MDWIQLNFQAKYHCNLSSTWSVRYLRLAKASVLLEIGVAGEELPLLRAPCFRLSFRVVSDRIRVSFLEETECIRYQSKHLLKRVVG